MLNNKILHSSNQYFLNLCTINNIQDISFILDLREADINYQDSNGTSALMIAVKNRFDNLTDLLLEYNINLNLKQNYNIGGESALHYAVRSNSPGIIKKLIKYGCEINPQNKYGQTPFILACELGFKEIIKELKICGANLEATCNLGKNGSMYLFEGKNNDIIQALALPPPKIFKTEDYCKFREEMRRVYGITDNRKKKKSKKNKKK